MQTYGDCPACGLRTYTYHDYELKLLRCPSCNASLEALEMDLEGLVDERGQVPIEPVWRGHQPFCPIHGGPAVLGTSGAYWCECGRQAQERHEQVRREVEAYEWRLSPGAHYRLPDGTLVVARWSTDWPSDHHWTLIPVDYPAGPDDGSDAYSIWIVWPNSIEREVPGGLAPTDLTLDDIRPA